MLFIYLAMIDDDTQRSKFEYIYHTYYGMMYKVAYELTKDQRLAEDAVHETMVNIIEDIDTIRMDNPKELKSYLYLVTKSKTIDFIRRWEKRKTSLYPADEVPEINNFDSPDEIGGRSAIRGIFQSLTADKKAGSVSGTTTSLTTAWMVLMLYK